MVRNLLHMGNLNFILTILWNMITLLWPRWLNCQRASPKRFFRTLPKNSVRINNLPQVNSSAKYKKISFPKFKTQMYKPWHPELYTFFFIVIQGTANSKQETIQCKCEWATVPRGFIDIFLLDSVSLGWFSWLVSWWSLTSARIPLFFPDPCNSKAG